MSKKHKFYPLEEVEKELGIAPEPSPTQRDVAQFPEPHNAVPQEKPLEKPPKGMKANDFENKMNELHSSLSAPPQDEAWMKDILDLTGRYVTAYKKEKGEAWVLQEIIDYISALLKRKEEEVKKGESWRRGYQQGIKEAQAQTAKEIVDMIRVLGVDQIKFYGDKLPFVFLFGKNGKKEDEERVAIYRQALEDLYRQIKSTFLP